MAEPEDFTLHLLREIREEMKGMGETITKLGSRMDEGFARIDKRMDSMSQAVHGESVLGRYAASRLDGLEKRVTELETKR